MSCLQMKTWAGSDCRQLGFSNIHRGSVECFALTSFGTTTKASCPCCRSRPSVCFLLCLLNKIYRIATEQLLHQHNLSSIWRQCAQIWSAYATLDRHSLHTHIQSAKTRLQTHHACDLALPLQAVTMDGASNCRQRMSIANQRSSHPSAFSILLSQLAAPSTGQTHFSC